MEWILWIFGWLGAIAAILTIGWQLDDGLGSNPGAKLRLAQSLRQGTSTGLTDWLQTTNQGFLNLFDRFYGGKGLWWEQSLWLALLVVPVVLAALHLPALAVPELDDDTTNLLALALVLTVFIVAPGLIGFRLTYYYSWSQITARDVGITSIISGIIITVLATIICIVFSITLGSSINIIFCIMSGIIIGAVFSIFFGIIGCIITGIIRISINPLKALGWSLVFAATIGVIQWQAGRLFIEAAIENYRVLAFVAFNVFADGVSLWETRWVLERGATARVPALLGLLLLDFVLSGVIYLVLPLALWPQILEFWDAVRFQGERPWLGLLFWTTFSTSFVFYVFVAAALLVRPLRAAAVGFGWIGNLFNLEEYPVRCLSVAMAVVITVIFAGVGVWEVVRGFGAAAATVP